MERRARRLQNKAEINRQNRESRHRREAGAVLAREVKAEIRKERGNDDPCPQRLARLEAMIKDLEEERARERGRPAPRRAAQSVEFDDDFSEPTIQSRRSGRDSLDRELELERAFDEDIFGYAQRQPAQIAVPSTVSSSRSSKSRPTITPSQARPPSTVSSRSSKKAPSVRAPPPVDPSYGFETDSDALSSYARDTRRIARGQRPLYRR